MSEEYEFFIKTDDGHFRLKIISLFGFPDTSHWGGYDTKSYVEIQAQDYQVGSEIYITTYEIYRFYVELNDSFNRLKGNAVLTSYEENLHLNLSFDELGHTKIRGTFRADNYINTILEFELSGDQSFLPDTLNSLKHIVDKYGNQFGNKISN